MRVHLSCLAASLLIGNVASAQTPAASSFTHTEPPKDDAKETGWKVEAKAGVIWLAGNASSTSISAGLNIARDAVWQRYSLVANYAFAKSSIYVLPRGATTPFEISSLDQLESQNSLTARLWNVTPRFDQWVIRNNARGDTSIYVTGNIASDYAAGKRLFGGGQVGVSNLLFKEGGHALVGELGYDFTYLEPYTTPVSTGGAYAIHSIRAALAYTWEISKATKLNAGVEYLINVNKESGAPNDDLSEPDDVPAFQDHRVNMVVGLSTQIYQRLSLLLTWQGRFDAKPQLFSPPPGVTFAPPGVFLKKFDSITQVQFVYTFG